MKSIKELIPTKSKLIRGVNKFHKHEARESSYVVTRYYLEKHWYNPEKMADAIEALLLSWNTAFYRYGNFNKKKLIDVLKKEKRTIFYFRKKKITQLSENDKPKIKKLFIELLKALEIKSKNNEVKRSTVSVVKTLHLLAPEFFPLWDKKIAKAYGIDYEKYRNNPIAQSEKYIEFMEITRKIVEKLMKYDLPESYKKDLLKKLDEYNYSHFTKGWC